VRDPDRRSQVCGVNGVLVVATDQEHLLVAVGDPGELGAEPGANGGITNCARDVRVVELKVGPDVDDERSLRLLE
jgi:hypothetical protein